VYFKEGFLFFSGFCITALNVPVDMNPLGSSRYSAAFPVLLPSGEIVGMDKIPFSY
jgi:hypothetical protein